jgi:hypothetical protein
MQRRAKFLIMSNARSGSTWLQTTLGALPDAVTDCEFKWNVRYEPRDVHYPLDENSPPVVDILDELSGSTPVVGSKFVFDTAEFPYAELGKLRSKLEGSLRIVHLVRRYRDIFLSTRRGFIHQINQASPWKIGARLRSVFGHELVGVIAPAHVSRSVCYAELTTYLQNDLWVSSLYKTGAPYLRVSYENLGARMAEIAEFVGSTATQSVVSAVTQCPVTLKLPNVAPDRLIENLKELEPIFEQFELIREYVFSRRNYASDRI